MNIRVNSILKEYPKFLFLQDQSIYHKVFCLMAYKPLRVI